MTDSLSVGQKYEHPDYGLVVVKEIHPFYVRFKLANSEPVPKEHLPMELRGRFENAIEPTTEDVR